MLRGKSVVLRPPIPSDAEDRWSYGDDPELWRLYGEEPRQLTFEAATHAFGVALNADPNVWGWVFEADGKAVGHARLTLLESGTHTARYAVGIFNRAYWGRGIGTEATRLILQFGFEQLGLHRIELRVVEYNQRAIRSYEKCGFVREGLDRDTVFLDGRWHSDVRMAILEAEYRAAAPRWQTVTADPAPQPSF